MTARPWYVVLGEGVAPTPPMMLVNADTFDPDALEHLMRGEPGQIVFCHGDANKAIQVLPERLDLAEALSAGYASWRQAA